MAIIVFERSLVPGTPGLLAMIQFDATMAETPSHSATVSKHPMEAGADIADHISPQNPTVELSAFVTNTPLATLSYPLLVDVEASRAVGLPLPFSVVANHKKQVAYGAVTGGVAQPFAAPGFPRYVSPVTVTPSTWVDVPEMVGGMSLQFIKRFDRVKGIYTALVEMVNNGTVCTLYTKLNDFTDMVITSLSAPTECADAITFSLTLEKVRFATVASSVAAKLTPLEPRAQKVIAQGPPGAGVDLSSLSPLAVQSAVAAMAEGTAGLVTR